MKHTEKTVTVTHDEKVDMGYIYLREIEPSGVKSTVNVHGKNINLDFDAEGRLIGIEVFQATEKLPQELLSD